MKNANAGKRIVLVAVRCTKCKVRTFTSATWYRLTDSCCNKCCNNASTWIFKSIPCRNTKQSANTFPKGNYLDISSRPKMKDKPLSFFVNFSLHVSSQHISLLEMLSVPKSSYDEILGLLQLDFERLCLVLLVVLYASYLKFGLVIVDFRVHDPLGSCELVRSLYRDTCVMLDLHPVKLGYW